MRLHRAIHARPRHDPQSRAGVSPAPFAQRPLAAGAFGAGQARRLTYFGGPVQTSTADREAP
jgi:hypothetical protein